MRIQRKHLVILAGVLIVALCAVIRMSMGKASASQSSDPSAQPVAVASVERRPIANTITLSGEFRPFQEVDVHAKVAGYIRKIYVDVGDRVKTGQALAILEVPELSAQLQGADAAVRRARDAVRRSKSDLARAQSLHEATHLDYTRLDQAAKARPGLIAQQELDDVLAKDKESEAQISADEAALSEAGNELDVAIANQKQLNALSDYTRIVAPFNGVITHRFVDTGALVQAGTNSNTQALPVVSVAETDLFRLTLPVPESAVPMIHLGTNVTVHVQALNRNFEGRVSRFADDVNQETRTMHTEVDVPNTDNTLVSGMYAEVSLTLAKKDGVLTVPIQAITRNGSQATVLVVNLDSRLEQREVSLGMEGTNRLEILSGLGEGDRVVIGSRSQFRPGERVIPKPIADRGAARGEF
jgi:RND family efflux transporter MFP subunit